MDETSLKLFPTPLIRGNKKIHENQSFMNFLYILIKLRFSWL